jgi:hypothetical protein
MAVKKEIIQFNVSNLTDCNFGVKLFNSQTATINATTKYGWTLSNGFEVFTNDDTNVYGNLTSCAGPDNYSCGSWDIVINGASYTVAFNGTIDGAVQALTALGFGLFCYQSVTITTTTTSTSTTAASTSTTTTSSTTAPTTSTTTSTTTIVTIDYLADRINCSDCSIDSSIIVSIDAAHIPVIGNYYQPLVADGFTYQLGPVSGSGPGLVISTNNFTTCPGSCL